MFDSNSPALAAIAESAGGLPSYLGVLPDNRKRLEDTLSALRGFDLAVVTGGISVGDFDFMAHMQERIPLRWDFEKVKQKPGKPFSFGELNGFPLMALPGNPVSAFFCAFFYLTLALLRLQGAGRCLPEGVKVVLGEKISRKKGFTCFDRANVLNENGTLTAYPYKTQSSGIFSSLISCNAFLEIPAEAEALPKGTVLTAYFYK
jgi:molybdopterin molybdotransferase